MYFLTNELLSPKQKLPNILLASFATAYAGGIPKKIKKGVIRNPPPTPNKPERIPTTSA